MIGIEARTQAATAHSRDLLADIDVTISNRAEDVDDAIRVVHDGFVEAGYMAPQPSGRRMHASYLNPGTFFVVARIEGRPVASIALVADGPFGLPSDRAFIEEIDTLRSHPGREVREVGSMVVRSEWRRHTRRIVLRVLAAVTRIILEECPTAHIVMSMAPDGVRFAAGTWGCDIYPDSRPLFGAPALLLRTDGPAIVDTLGARDTSSRRTMHALVNEENPEWLADRRVDAPLPAAWLRPLLAEQGTLKRMNDQVALTTSLALTHQEGLTMGTAAGSRLLP